jgi:hypothetical protein
MSDKHALLMEIHLPDADEPLRLMSGQGFEALRTDNTGREIFGLAHNGQDYLFFPFSFRPLDAGVLSMNLPPEYDEHCLGENPDGARIVFGSTNGTPVFAAMPEEYHSSSRTQRQDANGAIRVLLDKVDPHQVTRDHDGDGCACGHHHAGKPEVKAAAGEDHPHDRQEHGHGPIPDADLAALLRKKARELNAALALASEAGLSARLAVVESDESNGPQVRVVSVARML